MIKKHLYQIFAISLPVLLLYLPEQLHATSLQPQRFTTENGMTVLILEQPSLPIVSVQILVRAGAVLDPKDKAGLANLTASLLEQGTQNRNALEISESIESIGADLSTRASEDYVSLQLRILKKDLETGFNILSDLLMHPAFDNEEISRRKKQVLGRIRAEKDQPGAIAQRAFQKAVFRNHPYHQAVVGDENSIPKIDRLDLVHFHKQYFHPNNTIIAFAGDLTKAEAGLLLERYLGKWPKKTLVFPAVDPVLPLPKTRTLRIDKTLTQATVMLGHVGLNRSHPDYYPVLVMNYILGGGGFASRMMTEVRDNRGLVYSIYSYFSANALPGDFSVSFQTQNSNTREAIAAVLDMMRQIQKTGVTPLELSEAKAYLSGSFPLKIDTTKKAAAILASAEFHGLGLDYFENYPKEINRVTQEDVLRVAKKYLHPDRYVLVIVGNQKEINLKE